MAVKDNHHGISPGTLAFYCTQIKVDIEKRFKCGIKYLNMVFNIPYLKASSTLMTCLSYLYFKSRRDLGMNFWRGMNFHPVARLKPKKELKTYAR